MTRPFPATLKPVIRRYQVLEAIRAAPQLRYEVRPAETGYRIWDHRLQAWDREPVAPLASELTERCAALNALYEGMDPRLKALISALSYRDKCEWQRWLDECGDVPQGMIRIHCKGGGAYLVLGGEYTELNADRARRADERDAGCAGRLKVAA